MTEHTDAEGNGDSVSAAVQAERIALLTSVLAQTQNRLSTEILTQQHQHAHAQAQVLASASAASASNSNSRLPSSHITSPAVSPSNPIAYPRAQHQHGHGHGPISRPQSNSTLNSQQWPNSNHVIRQASSAPDFVNSNIVYQTPATSSSAKRSSTSAWPRRRWRCAPPGRHGAPTGG